jgi:hypothetical protein
VIIIILKFDRGPSDPGNVIGVIVNQKIKWNRQEMNIDYHDICRWPH